ncbi:MAG: hypothetical protein EP338_00640 [Bacteroidetes bacterium]|nr:MAG: hypothetical protein EP338_00640 [Bacteroidota bacterium]
MNEKKMNLISNVIKYGLIGLGVLLCLMIISGPNVEAGTETVEKFRDGFKLSAAVNFTGLVLFIATAAIVIFFGLLLATNFKKAIKSMIWIVAFFFLYLILRMIGTGDTSDTLNLKNAVADATVDGTHAGLMTCIIGLILALIAILAGPFLGRFRK